MHNNEAIALPPHINDPIKVKTLKYLSCEIGSKLGSMYQPSFCSEMDHLQVYLLIDLIDNM